MGIGLPKQPETVTSNHPPRFVQCSAALYLYGAAEVLHSGRMLPSSDGVASRRFALTLLAFIVDIAFALSLGGLLGMHARMVWLNVTTIEMFEKRRVTQWPFDRGPRRNFQEVFGARFVQGPTPFIER